MQVTIYTTPTCHFCHMTKDFFKENNVEYKEVDVSVDHAAAQAMVEKTGQMGVPVIIISKDKEGDSEPEDTIIIGFDKDRLTEILGL